MKTASLIRYELSRRFGGIRHWGSYTTIFFLYVLVSFFFLVLPYLPELPEISGMPEVPSLSDFGLAQLDEPDLDGYRDKRTPSWAKSTYISDCYKRKDQKGFCLYDLVVIYRDGQEPYIPNENDLEKIYEVNQESERLDRITAYTPYRKPGDLIGYWFERVLSYSTTNTSFYAVEKDERASDAALAHAVNYQRSKDNRYGVINCRYKVKEKGFVGTSVHWFREKPSFLDDPLLRIKYPKYPLFNIKEPVETCPMYMAKYAK